MQIKTIDIPSKSRGVFLCVVISVLLAACASSEQLDTNELFKQYFQPAKNDVVNTIDGAAAQQLHEQAFRLYDQERYHQALLLFDEVLRVDENPDFLFFKANTLLVLGQYQSAYQAFTAVPAQNKRYTDSQWYAALAAMMLGNNENSQQHLKQVGKATSTHQSAAKALLRLLD